mgnify:CR=1 FL=1
MPKLQEKLAEVYAPQRDEIKQLVKEHGDKVVSQVTVKQVSVSYTHLTLPTKRIV